VGRGFDTCRCGNIDAEALAVPGQGRVFGGKHGEYMILDDTAADRSYT